MPAPLSGLDAAFLYLETPTMHMHVGSVIVLDPGGRAFTADDLCAYLRPRLHLAPLFRRRLVEVPLGLDHPRWIEDPDFDLEHHVRRAALPSPGGMAELGELAGDIMSRPLDRSRPLWEAWVVEGLEGDRSAIVTKVHHAAIDGISGVEVASAILSPDPDPPPPGEDDWTPERLPSDLELVTTAVARNVLLPWRTVRLGIDAAGAAAKLLTRRVRTAGRSHDPARLGVPVPFEAPLTVLNGKITAHRRAVFATAELERVKQVKRRLGGTVNDVVLAAVTASLRRYLADAGDPLTRPLVAMVPISIRAHGPNDHGTNQVSMMLVGLPVHVGDPLEAYAMLRSGTHDAKRTHGAVGARTIQDLAELAVGGVFSLAVRTYSRSSAADHHRPLWNTVVSNVPGPRIPLYCAGARMEAMYPLGPVHEGVGVNITLFSYLDRLHVGINTDRLRIANPQSLADGVVDGIEELAKLAEA